MRLRADSSSDDPVDIGGLTLVDDRPDLYPLVEGVADDEGLGPSHEGFDVSAGDALVDEVAVSSEADLSLVNEGPPGPLTPPAQP